MRAGRYVLTVVGCVAASLVNPYGYHLHVHLYKYLRDPYQFRNINEFLSMDFQNPAAIYFEVLMVLGAVAAYRNVCRMDFAHAFLFLGWAHLGLFSRRNVPLFMIVAAPMAAATLRDLLTWLQTAPAAKWLRMLSTRFEQAAAEFGEIDVLPRFHLASVVFLFGIGALLFAGGAPKFEAQYDPKRYPAQAVAFLNQQPGEALFTHDEWGDYLIYASWPKRKVFIDGRSDFYGDELGEEVGRILNVKYDWEAALSRYGVDTVLMPVDAPLASTLKESRRWRCVYDDGMAIVFRPAGVLHGPGRQSTSIASISGTGSGHGPVTSNLTKLAQLN